MQNEFRRGALDHGAPPKRTLRPPRHRWTASLLAPFPPAGPALRLLAASRDPGLPSRRRPGCDLCERRGGLENKKPSGASAREGPSKNGCRPALCGTALKSRTRAIDWPPAIRQFRNVFQCALHRSTLGLSRDAMSAKGPASTLERMASQELDWERDASALEGRRCGHYLCAAALSGFFGIWISSTTHWPRSATHR